MVSCEYCESEIDGDVMVPENAGPMHTKCWIEWVAEQNGAKQ